MSNEPKVLLTTLWQRTSERGNEYLSGFLGKARIVGFRGEPTADGTPTWDIYLQPGREQDEGARRAPAASPRPSVQRQQRPPEPPGPPLPDDRVDDLWRGGEGDG